MGVYADRLSRNIIEYLKGSLWQVTVESLDSSFSDTHTSVHLTMPEGMEMSEPFQQRIWDILEQLPDIDLPRETVYLTIRKPGWDHYYKTPINPGPEDFKTVGMSPDKRISVEEFERRKGGGI